MLINLVDGGVKEIYTDEDSFPGCETCDYGSEYINEVEIELTTGSVYVKINNMYDYALTSDYMMKLFLTNIEDIKTMTELGLYEWVKGKIEEEFSDSVDELNIDYKLKK